MGILDGKVAVVTGATRGFGQAVARSLLQEGCRVIISSRNAENVASSLEELDAPGQVVGCKCDVSDLEQVRALKNLALSSFGQMDIWVNNAGIAGPYGPTMGVAPDTFMSVLNTNIVGVYNGSFIAIEYFLTINSGKLINILGQGYKGPVAYQNAYSSTKYWVRSFTQCLAEENKDSKVGIFAFHPGMMLTDLLTNVDVVSGYEDKLNAFPTIVRMWAKPPEIPARKVAWLTSSATDGQTGKLVSTMSTGDMLSGAIREGWHRVIGKKGESDLKIHSVPYAKS